jgi:hypothetical protein
MHRRLLRFSDLSFLKPFDRSSTYPSVTAVVAIDARPRAPDGVSSRTGALAAVFVAADASGVGHGLGRVAVSSRTRHGRVCGNCVFWLTVMLEVEVDKESSGATMR